MRAFLRGWRVPAERLLYAAAVERHARGGQSIGHGRQRVGERGCDGMAAAARRDCLGGDRAAAAQPGPPRMPCPCTRGRCTGGESEGAPWRRRAAAQPRTRRRILRFRRKGRDAWTRPGRARPAAASGRRPPAPSYQPSVPPGLERGLPARQVWPLVGRPADGLSFSRTPRPWPWPPWPRRRATLPDPPTCPQGPCAPRAPAFRPPFSPPSARARPLAGPAVILKTLDPAPHAVYDRRRAAHWRPKGAASPALAASLRPCLLRPRSRRASIA